MTKTRYFAFRTIQTLFMLFLIVTFLFFFFRMMPGDITSLMLYGGASPEAVEAFEERWGLNDPLHIQYIRYLRNLIVGDAGYSLQYQIPVIEFVGMKIFNSAILMAPAITAGYLAGSLNGTLLGTTKRSTLEKVGITITIFIGTIPIFFLAIIAIVIFAGNLGWFPTGGLVSTDLTYKFKDAQWWRIYMTKDFTIHYILPFSVIMARYSYLPTLIMRTSIGEVTGQGFSYYHRVTGLPRWRRLQHLAKHASLPVITYYPLSMTRAIGGLVLVEVVFNWPGMGAALVDAVLARDFPIVQFVFIMIAIFILLGNYAVDIVYGIIDPRVSIDGTNND